MKRFKQAVTLVEVLITMGIIGIIAMFAITTIKPYEKTYKWLYIRIFNVLETSVYNSMLDRAAFPTTSAAFCSMLIEYMNVAENNCNANGDLAALAADFPEENIKLVLSNGMRLWIGSNKGAPFVKTQKIPGTTQTYNMKYYMVYVDITGEKPPNRVEWTAGGKLADIVAFAVTESSVVIPLGPPEIDTRYLTATVIYPPIDENQPEGNKSLPMSYADAKAVAWGQSINEVEIRSWQFNTSDVISANGPFAVPYPTPPELGSECTEEHNRVSPCYVKIDNFN